LELFATYGGKQFSLRFSSSGKMRDRCLSAVPELQAEYLNTTSRKDNTTLNSLKTQSINHREAGPARLNPMFMAADCNGEWTCSLMQIFHHFLHMISCPTQVTLRDNAFQVILGFLSGCVTFLLTASNFAIVETKTAGYIMLFIHEQWSSQRERGGDRDDQTIL
jgi:hypothetical protein